MATASSQDSCIAILAIRSVFEKANCKNTLMQHIDRVKYFEKRIEEKGLNPADVIITLLNVDDPQGKVIADILMPGYDWQAIRDTGAVPYARGLAGREGIQSLLDEIDPEEAEILREAGPVPTVIVMDHGVVKIFPDSEWF
jgi:hypothetical protein